MPRCGYVGCARIYDIRTGDLVTYDKMLNEHFHTECYRACMREIELEREKGESAYTVYKRMVEKMADMRPKKDSDTHVLQGGGGESIYDEAKNYFAEVQAKQIEKGRKKYPEDLNPDSWTAEQLIDHAMQEAVDQVHYLTALRKKIRKF